MLIDGATRVGPEKDAGHLMPIQQMDNHRVQAIIRLIPGAVPSVAVIARAGRSLAVFRQTFGRRLYEAVLAFLEGLPGGWCVVRALRAFAEPACLRVGSIVLLHFRGSPSFLDSSVRRLVVRSARCLRGPDAALDPLQPQGAAVV